MDINMEKVPKKVTSEKFVKYLLGTLTFLKKIYVVLAFSRAE